MPCPAPLFGNVGVDISLAPRRESNYKDHLSPSATYIQAYSSLADSYRQRIGYWAMIPAPMPLQKSAVSRQARIYFQPFHEATKCLEYIFRGVGRRLSLTAGKPQVSMYGRELNGMPAVICAAAQLVPFVFCLLSAAACEIVLRHHANFSSSSNCINRPK